MNYDFEYDSAKVTSVIVTMYYAYNNLLTNCDGLFDTVVGMENSWKGDGYNIFYNGIQQYKSSIYGIPAILHAFRQSVIDARDDGDDLVRAVKKAIEFE